MNADQPASSTDDAHVFSGPRGAWNPGLVELAGRMKLLEFCEQQVARSGSARFSESIQEISVLIVVRNGANSLDFASFTRTR